MMSALRSNWSAATSRSSSIFLMMSALPSNWRAASPSAPNPLAALKFERGFAQPVFRKVDALKFEGISLQLVEHLLDDVSPAVKPFDGVMASPCRYSRRRGAVSPETLCGPPGRPVMFDGGTTRRARGVMVVCQGRLAAQKGCGWRSRRGLTARFSGGFGLPDRHGQATYRGRVGPKATPMPWPLMGLAHRNRDFGKLGNFRSKLLGKMVTNESLAARNLTAACHSTGFRAQTCGPWELYRCFMPPALDFHRHSHWGNLANEFHPAFSTSHCRLTKLLPTVRL